MEVSVDHSEPLAAFDHLVNRQLRFLDECDEGVGISAIGPSAFVYEFRQPIAVNVLS